MVLATIAIDTANELPGMQIMHFTFPWELVPHLPVESKYANTNNRLVLMKPQTVESNSC